MIGGFVGLCFDWIEQLEHIAPDVLFSVPSIMLVATQMNILASAVLPMAEIKFALQLALVFWAARFALIPVRWLIVLGRGVNPG